MSESTRSIIVEHSDGTATKVEDIPSNAKITFGALQPGKPSYHESHVLRIYTSQSNQLAVFRDVASFRDMSLTISVREVTTETDETTIRDPRGIQQHAHHSENSARFVKMSDQF